jgi:hypothetical protein
VLPLYLEALMSRLALNEQRVVCVGSQCMDEEICDIIQPEKQQLTHTYANNGLNFDRHPDANISVLPFTATGMPSKL